MGAVMGPFAVASLLGVPAGLELARAGGRPSRWQVWEQYLTVREVATLVNVATSTVCKLCAEGKLAYVRVSNAIRVHPDAVVALQH